MARWYVGAPQEQTDEGFDCSLPSRHSRPCWRQPLIYRRQHIPRCGDLVFLHVTPYLICYHPQATFSPRVSRFRHVSPFHMIFVPHPPLGPRFCYLSQPMVHTNPTTVPYAARR